MRRQLGRCHDRPDRWQLAERLRQSRDADRQSNPSGGGSQPMAASPPNLAALPGGAAHLAPLAQHGPIPNATPNGFVLHVLYQGQPFTVAASGKTMASDQEKWRDNDDVPIARNILARMDG